MREPDLADEPTLQHRFLQSVVDAYEDEIRAKMRSIGCMTLGRPCQRAAVCPRFAPPDIPTDLIPPQE